MAIFIGGGFGSLLRYGIGLLWQGSSFPWATMTANALSSLLLGMFVGWFDQTDFVDDRIRLFLVTGLCGGFSTFSTFSYETFKLWSEGEHLAFFTNIGGSVIVCLFCIFLGFKIISLFI